MKKKIKLLDVLQAGLNLIPLNDRANSTIEFDINRQNISGNLEVLYQNSNQRIAQLAYYTHWSSNFRDNSDLQPELLLDKIDGNIGMVFNDPTVLKKNVVQSLNNDFSSWISNQVIRELNEYLLFYLLDLYEVCLVVQQAAKPIKPRDVVDIQKKSKKFEKSGLKDRLKELRKNFGIEVAHSKELVSLYVIRNIFAHFDGIVQRKFCKDGEKLEVFWPQNTYELERRSDGKAVSYDSVPKPFKGNDYSQIHITWLNKPYCKTYQVGEKILLTREQINELFFFYLSVFNELQRGLVNFCELNDVRVKDPSQYLSEPSIEWSTQAK